LLPATLTGKYTCDIKNNIYQDTNKLQATCKECDGLMETTLKRKTVKIGPMADCKHIGIYNSVYKLGSSTMRE
jgi:hypothetical protein